METTTLNIVSIIIIVFGILQIILFFKVWEMTDNVKMIKGNLVDNTNAFKEAKKELMLGHLDKAFEIYNKCFVSDVIALHKNTKTAGMDSKPAEDMYATKYKEKCQYYKKELSKLGDNYSIDFSKFDNFEKINKILS